MGVKTSSDFLKRKDPNAGVVNRGSKPDFRNHPDHIIVFRFPTPVQGESSIFLNVGEKKPTRIKLKDGSYTLPANWEKRKKSIYRKALLDAGLIEEATFKEGTTKKKAPAKKFTYFAGHPDNQADEKKSGKTVLTIKDENIDLEIVEGVITTTDKNVYDALIKKGYYEAKQPKEITEEKKTTAVKPTSPVKTPSKPEEVILKDGFDPKAEKPKAESAKDIKPEEDK